MKRYLFFLLSGVILSMTFVSVFNWMINPYDIFSAPDIEGLNQYKSEVGRHTRLSKVYQVEKIKPDAILLASSRGLVVPDSYFSGDKMTGFNFSLASASTYELFRVLQHAQSVKPLTRVILALDETFTLTTQNNFTENRLAVNPDGSENRLKWLTMWQDAFSSLLSIDSLRSSLRTIRMQSESQGAENALQFSHRRVSNAGGHRQMFRTMESSILLEHKRSGRKCPDSIPASMPEAIAFESVKFFEEIVAFSYSNDIELYVYISPVHARLYEVNCMIGRWYELENMKREVVDVIDKLARINNKKAYPVWDFSGYNAITMEEVPELGDKETMMDWYLEGSHYTEETARVVLDKVLGKNRFDQNFGVIITKDSIDKHLFDIRRKRTEYIKKHGEDVKELLLLLEAAVLQKNVLE